MVVIKSGFRCADIQRQTDVHDISDVVVVVIQDLSSPSISHSPFPSHPTHAAVITHSSSLSCPSENRMKIALSAKFKYGHATPEKVEREGGAICK